MELIEFLEEGKHHFIPNLSIDMVIIGYQNEALKCLLLRIGENWILPGGYIFLNESVDQAAIRILKERTNLEDPHLKFLNVAGNPDRRFTNEWKSFFVDKEIPWKEDYWINKRFVSLIYYSLVEIENVDPIKGTLDDEISWFDMKALPAMGLDHRDIVIAARNRLKEDVQKELVTYNLLPEPFTMPELHRLYQTILEEEVDRSRFQKKMLATGMFERLPKRNNIAPGRNPYQYKIKQK